MILKEVLVYLVYLKVKIYDERSIVCTVSSINKYSVQYIQQSQLVLLNYKQFIANPFLVSSRTAPASILPRASVVLSALKKCKEHFQGRLRIAILYRLVFLLSIL